MKTAISWLELFAKHKVATLEVRNQDLSKGRDSCHRVGRPLKIVYVDTHWWMLWMDHRTNPYVPTATHSITRDAVSAKLQAVCRIFMWMGLLGSVIYIPIVVGCTGALIASLFGRPISDPKIGTPLMLAFATLFNTAVLSVWLIFIVTARQIKKRDYTVRSRALALSVFLTLGFPILTIPGVMCYRWIRQYFRDDFDEQWMSMVENRTENCLPNDPPSTRDLES